MHAPPGGHRPAWIAAGRHRRPSLQLNTRTLGNCTLSPAARANLADVLGPTGLRSVCDNLAHVDIEALVAWPPAISVDENITLELHASVAGRTSTQQLPFTASEHSINHWALVFSQAGHAGVVPAAWAAAQALEGGFGGIGGAEGRQPLMLVAVLNSSEVVAVQLVAPVSAGSIISSISVHPQTSGTLAIYLGPISEQLLHPQQLHHHIQSPHTHPALATTNTTASPAPEAGTAPAPAATAPITAESGSTLQAGAHQGEEPLFHLLATFLRAPTTRVILVPVVPAPAAAELCALLPSMACQGAGEDVTAVLAPVTAVTPAGAAAAPAVSGGGTSLGSRGGMGDVLSLSSGSLIGSEGSDGYEAGRSSSNGSSPSAHPASHPVLTAPSPHAPSPHAPSAATYATQPGAPPGTGAHTPSVPTITPSSLPPFLLLPPRHQGMVSHAWQAYFQPLAADLDQLMSSASALQAAGANTINTINTINTVGSSVGSGHGFSMQACGASSSSGGGGGGDGAPASSPRVHQGLGGSPAVVSTPTPTPSAAPTTPCTWASPASHTQASPASMWVRGSPYHSPFATPAAQANPADPTHWGTRGQGGDAGGASGCAVRGGHVVCWQQGAGVEVVQVLGPVAASHHVQLLSSVLSFLVANNLHAAATFLAAACGCSTCAGAPLPQQRPHHHAPPASHPAHLRGEAAAGDSGFHTPPLSSARHEAHPAPCHAFTPPPYHPPADLPMRSSSSSSKVKGWSSCNDTAQLSCSDGGDGSPYNVFRVWGLGDSPSSVYMSCTEGVSPWSREHSSSPPTPPSPTPPLFPNLSHPHRPHHTLPHATTLHPPPLRRPSSVPRFSHSLNQPPANTQAANQASTPGNNSITTSAPSLFPGSEVGQKVTEECEGWDEVESPTAYAGIASGVPTLTPTAAMADTQQPGGAPADAAAGLGVEGRGEGGDNQARASHPSLSQLLDVSLGVYGVSGLFSPPAGLYGSAVAAAASTAVTAQGTIGERLTGPLAAALHAATAAATTTTSDAAAGGGVGDGAHCGLDFCFSPIPQRPSPPAPFLSPFASPHAGLLGLARQGSCPGAGVGGSEEAGRAHAEGSLQHRSSSLQHPGAALQHSHHHHHPYQDQHHQQQQQQVPRVPSLTSLIQCRQEHNMQEVAPGSGSNAAAPSALGLGAETQYGPPTTVAATAAVSASTHIAPCPFTAWRQWLSDSACEAGTPTTTPASINPQHHASPENGGAFPADTTTDGSSNAIANNKGSGSSNIGGSSHSGSLWVHTQPQVHAPPPQPTLGAPPQPANLLTSCTPPVPAYLLPTSTPTAAATFPQALVHTEVDPHPLSAKHEHALTSGTWQGPSHGSGAFKTLPPASTAPSNPQASSAHRPGAPPPLPLLRNTTTTSTSTIPASLHTLVPTNTTTTSAALATAATIPTLTPAPTSPPKPSTPRALRAALQLLGSPPAAAGRLVGSAASALAGAVGVSRLVGGHGGGATAQLTPSGGGDGGVGCGSVVSRSGVIGPGLPTHSQPVVCPASLLSPGTSPSKDPLLNKRGAASSPAGKHSGIQLPGRPSSSPSMVGTGGGGEGRLWHGTQSTGAGQRQLQQQPQQQQQQQLSRPHHPSRSAVLRVPATPPTAKLAAMGAPGALGGGRVGGGDQGSLYEPLLMEDGGGGGGGGGGCGGRSDLEHGLSCHLAAQRRSLSALKAPGLFVRRVVAGWGVRVPLSHWGRGDWVAMVVVVFVVAALIVCIVLAAVMWA